MVELLGLRRRRAQVIQTDHDQGRCLYITHQRYGREFEVLLRMGPGRAGIAGVVVAEPVVGVQCFAVPVHHRFDHRRRAKAPGFANDPGGHEAARAAPGDVQALGVDIAALKHRVDAVHNVVVILAGIVVIEQVGECFTVARAAARVGEEHHVAGGGVELHFRREALPVVADRAAVVFHQQRIGVGGIETRRGQDPALHVAAIDAAAPPDFLGVTQPALRQQIAV